METGGGPFSSNSSRPITDRNSSYKFPLIGGISVDRLSSSQPLQCRDLIGHRGGQGVSVFEFSDDGSLFASGGDDGRVLLWPTSEALEEEWTPNPTAMETEHKVATWCLAISHDNQRLFSGGLDRKLLIHNVNTYNFLILIQYFFNTFWFISFSNLTGKSHWIHLNIQVMSTKFRFSQRRMEMFLPQSVTMTHFVCLTRAKAERVSCLKETLKMTN